MFAGAELTWPQLRGQQAVPSRLRMPVWQVGSPPPPKEGGSDGYGDKEDPGRAWTQEGSLKKYWMGRGRRNGG